ncbi:MAG TPA: pyruvate kinase [Pirellulaceae bacterium]|nr:pyruvate kinase [Pirellulaceae bacterium]
MSDASIPGSGPTASSRTKIVATVGPACQSPEMLRELIRTGVNVFRINTAHGTRAEHQATLHAIREASVDCDRPVGALVDLAGPKIRLGQLLEDPTGCPLGAEFWFIRGQTPGKANEFTCTYESLVAELAVGDCVMLADGTVSLRVVEKDESSARCIVTGAGFVRSRQGVNLPGVALSVPAMTEADISNAIWAAEAGADFISLSFVRSPVEVRQLKELVHSHGSRALIIAKIEKGEALEHLDDIVLAAGGIMVARGDLGVEIDLAETPVAQKRIIEVCQRLAKPVIVATQMLDSMQNSPRPTRAEVSDIANAILDGADACMLSGETAIGKHPREAVDVMRRVMLSTERTLARTTGEQVPIAALSGVHPITAATVFGASEIASRVNAKLIVIASNGGATARVKAKFRSAIPVVGVSDNESTLRRMTLFWGILPLPGAPVANGPQLREFIENWGRATGVLAKGDRVVYVTGSEVIAHAHNVVVVQEVE